MTIPADILGTDRHVRLAQINCYAKRGKWYASGTRHTLAIPPVATTGAAGNGTTDQVNSAAVSDPPAAGERLPSPKRAIFSMVRADVSFGLGNAGVAHNPPSFPMPGERA